MLSSEKCPYCFRYLGTWLKDPIFLPNGGPYLWTSDTEIVKEDRLDHKLYKGFQQVTEPMVQEIQDVLNQAEIDNSITPLTDWSSLSLDGKFQITGKHIKEMRDSVEKLLTKLGLTKTDYFNYDEDGNHIIQPNGDKLDWTDPITNAIDLKKFQVKYIHIEDLRHYIAVVLDWIEDWSVTPDETFFDVAESSTITLTEDDLQGQCTGDKQGEDAWASFGYYKQDSYPSGGNGTVKSSILSTEIKLELEATSHVVQVWGGIPPAWYDVQGAQFTITDKVEEEGTLTNPVIYIKKYPSSTLYDTTLTLLSSCSHVLTDASSYNAGTTVNTYVSFRLEIEFRYSGGVGHKLVYFDFYSGLASNPGYYGTYEFWAPTYYPNFPSSGLNVTFLPSNLNNLNVNLKNLIETYYAADVASSINIQVQQLKFLCLGNIQGTVTPGEIHLKTLFDVNKITFSNLAI
jgi:hypothetical protein